MQREAEEKTRVAEEKERREAAEARAREYAEYQRKRKTELEEKRLAINQRIQDLESQKSELMDELLVNQEAYKKENPNRQRNFEWLCLLFVFSVIGGASLIAFFSASTEMVTNSRCANLLEAIPAAVSMMLINLPPKSVL